MKIVYYLYIFFGFSEFLYIFGAFAPITFI